jgi:hypothetical protein
VRTDQNGDTLWTRKHPVGPTGAESVLETTDGSLVVAGYLYTTAKDRDFYIMQMDASGDTIWTRAYGGPELDQCYSLERTSDGGYIMVGRTSSYGAGRTDIYIVKTDANGDSAWTKVYGGTGYDGAYSVEEIADGGYVICGYTTSYGAGTYDVYLLRTDASGDTMWTTTYGAYNQEYGHTVQQTPDGGFVIGGYTASFTAGSDDVYIIKTVGDCASVRSPRGMLRTILVEAAPNPFRGSTLISFTLPRAVRVQGAIYDVSGEYVATLCDVAAVLGAHTLQWDGTDYQGCRVSPGIYILRIRAEDQAATRKVVLIR